MSKKKVCPICGTEMKIDTSVVCTSIPPMYRCVCPSCNCLDFIKTSEYDQYKEQPSLSSDLDRNAAERKGFQQGYEWAEKDIISIIESSIGEILGDAQPAPVLRAELRELINKIKENGNSISNP